MISRNFCKGASSKWRFHVKSEWQKNHTISTLRTTARYNVSDTFYNKYLYFSDNHVPKSPRRGQISYQIRINSKKSTFESMYRTVQNLQASHHFLAENQVLCSFCNTVNIPSTFYYVCGTTCFLIKSIVNPRSSK